MALLGNPNTGSSFFDSGREHLVEETEAHVLVGFLLLYRRVSMTIVN
jgi:hypothetical protein